MKYDKYIFLGVTSYERRLMNTSMINPKRILVSFSILTVS